MPKGVIVEQRITGVGRPHTPRLTIGRANFRRLGIPRPMPPAYVSPHAKRQTNDMADADAICEAVTRANMCGAWPVEAMLSGLTGSSTNPAQTMINRMEQDDAGADVFAPDYRTWDRARPRLGVSAQNPTPRFRKRVGCEEEHAIGRDREDRNGVGERCRGR